MKTKNDRGLGLYEEVALLAFHDEKGTTRTELFGYAIASAILAELLLDGCIEIGKTKKQLVSVANDRKYGDAIIDEVISRIGSAKRNASIQMWVERISAFKKRKQRVAQRLCEKGILQEVPVKFLFLFNRTLYPEINSAPETLLVERLERAIFSDDAEVDERTMIVVSIANVIGLLNRGWVHECVGSSSLGTPQLLTVVAPCGRRLLLRC